MKELIITLFLLSTSIIYSQIDGSKGFGISIGYEKNGFIGNIYYTYYHNQDRFTRLGFNGHFENIDIKIEDYQTKNMHVNLYMVYMEHYIGILNIDQYKGIKIYGGLGATASYEEINKGNKFLKDGRAIKAESKYIYGVTGGLELAIYYHMENILVKLLNSH